MHCTDLGQVFNWLYLARPWTRSSHIAISCVDNIHTHSNHHHVGPRAIWGLQLDTASTPYFVCNILVSIIIVCTLQANPFSGEFGLYLLSQRTSLLTQVIGSETCYSGLIRLPSQASARAILSIYNAWTVVRLTSFLDWLFSTINSIISRNDGHTHSNIEYQISIVMLSSIV